jgi:hypothetical protein
MTLTSPEDYFQDFCTALGLAWELVPTASSEGQKRPDYLITGPGPSAFYVELKAVTPNEEESLQLERLYTGKGASSFNVEPGAKVRALIAKANPQLKAVVDEQLPGVLAILNPEPALSHHIEAYAVLTAMRGLDVVPVLVPKNPADPPIFQDVRSGPKKRMTRSANTTISAILVPYLTNDRGWAAEVYHNRFAARPLDPRALLWPTIRHWRIREDERDWEPHPAAV